MIGLLRSVPLWFWLAGALVLSLWINWVQLRASLTAEAEHTAALEAARLKGEVEALQDRADALDLQGRLLAQDAQTLLSNLSEINRREDAQLGAWRQLMRELPPLPAGCGPGAQRVEAFNQTMRAEP